MHQATVDITSEAFGARLAAILRAARQDQERSLRAMAWWSRGSFRTRTLKDLEAGRADPRTVDLAALAALYRLDLAALLQERVPLVVDVSAGSISTAGVARSFDPGHQDGLLLAYLHLVRDLRDLREAQSIALRREDVEVLASGLRADAAAVLDRLGELMGSTVTQRRSAVAMFTAGAALIVLSTGAIALEPGLYEAGPDGGEAAEVSVVTLATADDLGEGGGLGADGSGVGRVDVAGGRDVGGDPTGTVDPGADPSAPSSGGSPGASGPAGPGSGASDEPGGSTVGPGGPSVGQDGPSAAPGEPTTGSGRDAPPLDERVSGGPVAVSPVDDTPRTEPFAPNGPDEVGAERGTPPPSDAVPGPPGDGPAHDVPGAITPPTVDVPSGDLPPGGLPPGDTPTGDGPTVDVPVGVGPPEGGPSSDGPLSDGPPAGPPAGGPLDDGQPDDDPPTGPPADGPFDDGPPVGPPSDEDPSGGTPGNSPGRGNTPTVGQPGNSDTPNAGGSRGAKPQADAPSDDESIGSRNPNAGGPKAR